MSDYIIFRILKEPIFLFVAILLILIIPMWAVSSLINEESELILYVEEIEKTLVLHDDSTIEFIFPWQIENSEQVGTKNNIVVLNIKDSTLGIVVYSDKIEIYDELTLKNTRNFLENNLIKQVEYNSE